jgi:glycosyltransferase involved in cell wall biosynthesis
MKIGVFLSTRTPQEGGGYTITEEIFINFLREIKKINKSFFFLINNDNKKKYSKILTNNKFNFKEIKTGKLGKIIIYISHKFPFFDKILNKLNIIKINNIFKDENCELIFFLSSEYRERMYIPYICTVWDLQYKTHPYFEEVSSWGKLIYKNTVIDNFIKQSKIIITGSRVGKREIKKYLKYKNKIIILNHPVSMEFLKKNTNIFFKKIKNKFFLYPANLWKHKNHLNLIKAFKIFVKINKKFFLILVGEPKNNYKKIKELIKELQLQKKVFYLRFVSRKMLLGLYDNCFAVTFIPFSGPENLPPLEAFARKKIVINSLYNGSKEQLKNYPIYVNPYNVKSIYNGLMKSINLKNKKKITNSSYKYVKAKTAKNYIEKFLCETKSFTKI